MVKHSEKLLTVDEAATLLGLKSTTIRKWILCRQIPYVKVRYSVRIPVETIQTMIQDGWREPVAK